jgi:hypothetical protein
VPSIFNNGQVPRKPHSCHKVVTWMLGFLPVPLPSTTLPCKVHTVLPGLALACTALCGQFPAFLSQLHLLFHFRVAFCSMSLLLVWVSYAAQHLAYLKVVHSFTQQTFTEHQRHCSRHMRFTGEQCHLLMELTL